MYHVGKRPKSRHRRVIFWLVILLLIVGLIIIASATVHSDLRPHLTIKQSRAVVTKVSSNNTKTKQYTEPDFIIDLPTTWQAVPRPAGPYQSYTWQSNNRITDDQVIEIYEDTIPANFAVNKVLVVEGEGNQLMLDGTASDNCSYYTGDMSATPNQVGAPAKWQGVSFLCDQDNQQRDVVGTSSTDGINTVILKNPDTGISHKFFFTYTDYSDNPDYTVFYNALNSLRMQ